MQSRHGFTEYAMAINRSATISRQAEGVWGMDVRVGEAGPKGMGVFASRDFSRNETVVVGRAVSFPAQQTRMSIQIDWDRRVEMDEPATLLNHSCAPTLYVRENSWQAYDFVALGDIAANEELTFDYAMTEYVLAAPLDCRCGSPTCEGRIRPWSQRDSIWRESNAHLVSRYLRASLTQSLSASSHIGVDSQEA